MAPCRLVVTGVSEELDHAIFMGHPEYGSNSAETSELITNGHGAITQKFLNNVKNSNASISFLRHQNTAMCYTKETHCGNQTFYARSESMDSNKNS